jgi:hypothetical protein
MEFKSQLSGNRVSVFFKSEHTYDCEGTFEVEWQFDTEMREWGVKDISIYATKVEGKVEIMYWDDVKDRMEKIEISSDDEWDLQTEVNLEWGDEISPDDLQVDFQTKTLTVVF